MSSGVWVRVPPGALFKSCERFENITTYSIDDTRSLEDNKVGLLVVRMVRYELGLGLPPKFWTVVPLGSIPILLTAGLSSGFYNILIG